MPKHLQIQRAPTPIPNSPFPAGTLPISLTVDPTGEFAYLKEQQPVEEEMEVRFAIQQIALDHRRRYGYRRITAELHRRGMPVNHKRVARIIRQDNLLGMQPERFVVTTAAHPQAHRRGQIICSRS